MKTESVSREPSPTIPVADMVEVIRNRPPGRYPEDWNVWDNTIRAMQILASEEHERLQNVDYPEGQFRGRGIIIAGGAAPRPHKGLEHGYFPCVWVCVNKLRSLGCTLPIQVWHLGPEEMDPYLSGLLAKMDVQTVDARTIERKHPARILAGWELKPYSALWCDFEEVLFIDADNHALSDPEYLFGDPEYLHHGSMFWPDYDVWILEPGVWKIFGLHHRRESAFESGMFMIDKRKRWRELNLALWYAEHSDFVFRHVYGDKEVFHLGWRYHGTDYAMPEKKPGWVCAHTIVQYDNQEREIFSHRVQDKWKLYGGNHHCPALKDEDIHHQMAEELRTVWDGKLWFNSNPDQTEAKLISDLVGKVFLYRRLETENFNGDEREIEFLGNGEIGKGKAGLEKRWSVHVTDHPEIGRKVPAIAICSDNHLTCLLFHSDDGVFRGQWVDHERCGVELIPTGKACLEKGSPVVLRDVVGVLRRHGVDVDHVDVETIRTIINDKATVNDTQRETESRTVRAEVQKSG